jgi:hypothetical protein
MSYKFNRNCWMESLEERLYCGRDSKREAPLMQRITEPGIEDKIAGAERIFAKWGGQLKGDAGIREFIQRLEVRLEDSRRCMQDLEIFSMCARCDETAPEGSCCSTGLERKYGPITLLMNLLLGAALPKRRQRTDSCYFLGPTGCMLKVRHMLCVDYLCPELEKALGRKALMEIQTVSGEEITAAFLLFESLKKKMKILPA